MAGKLPYFPFFPDDWLSDEGLRSCSLGARGLYMDIQSLMFKARRRGFLQQRDGTPLSREQTARIAGCSPEEAGAFVQELESSGVVATSEDGVLYSPEMVRRERLRKVRSKAGKKGGATTGDLLRQKSKQNRSKTEANVERDAETNGVYEDTSSLFGGGFLDFSAECEGDKEEKKEREKKGPPHTPPKEERKKEEKKTPPLPPTGGVRRSCLEGFADFWAAYPRKVGKGAAERAWEKVAPDAALTAAIVAAVETQKRTDHQWRRDNGQYIPHPATWLNQRRWEDEAAVAAPPPSKTPEERAAAVLAERRRAAAERAAVDATEALRRLRGEGENGRLS